MISGDKTAAVQLNLNPTAQTLFDATAATAFSMFPVLLLAQEGGEPGLGLGTTVHFWPSQCSASVREPFNWLSF
jgi:hypothetical protein